MSFGFHNPFFYYRKKAKKDTVKSQAVEQSTIQFWNFLAKGLST